MTRALLLLALGVTVQSAGQAPVPSIQNGRVETRTTTALERDVNALIPRSGDPVWVGWRVAMVEGRRGGCCTYSDESPDSQIRGCFVDTNDNGRARPNIAPPSGPVSLEAGSGLIVLARLGNGHIERLRTLGDDCPLDADGRTVYWLQGASSADSLHLLNGLVNQTSVTKPQEEQRLSDSAVSAIALHADAGADAILDRIAEGTDSNLRRTARSLLGTTRGASGLATLRRLFEAERTTDGRRQLVTAIGQSRQPGTADVLFDVARRDPDPGVRGEAAYWLPQRGGRQALPQVLEVIQRDASDATKQRAVQGLSRLVPDDSTAPLIQLAQTSPDAAVKKAAVTALGRSKDPRAVAYMELLIKQD